MKSSAGKKATAKSYTKITSLLSLTIQWKSSELEGWHHICNAVNAAPRVHYLHTFGKGNRCTWGLLEFMFMYQ